MRFRIATPQPTIDIAMSANPNSTISVLPSPPVAGRTTPGSLVITWFGWSGRGLPSAPVGFCGVVIGSPGFPSLFFT